jgi:hypothetical protein
MYQKEVENVEYFNQLGTLITNDTTCGLDGAFNPGLPCQKQHSTRKTLYQQIKIKFQEETIKITRYDSRLF